MYSLISVLCFLPYSILSRGGCSRGMTKKRFWFQLHGWFSLPIWMLFALICITGTLAVISHELTWLANPDTRVSNPQNLPAKPLPELKSAVENAYAGAQVSLVYAMEPYLVTAVRFSSPDIPSAFAYVNPYTAEIQGMVQGITLIGFLRALHGWLLFPWQHSYSIGYYLVGAMSFVVLGALVTGLVVYKKFWRAFTAPRLRRAKGSRVFLGDLHRLGGVWSIWFLVIMGLTGFWYLVQGILWHNGIDIWPHEEPIELSSVPISDRLPPQPIALSKALQNAQQALPALNLQSINLPEHNRDYYTFNGTGDAFFFDRYSYQVKVNPWNGEVSSLRTPASMNLTQTLTHIADPLHYGTLLGLWTKAIWFCFGLILSAMSISGFLIYGKRLLKAGSYEKNVARKALDGETKSSDVVEGLQ